MIKTRLANLAFIPRAVPARAAGGNLGDHHFRLDAEGHWRGFRGLMRFRKSRPRKQKNFSMSEDLTHSSNDHTGGFWGVPDFRGGLKHALLMKFWPTYSRRKFLNKLSTADNAGHLRNIQLQEQVRCLHRERQALAQKCHAMEQQQKVYEQEQVNIDLERRQFRQRDLDRDHFLRSLSSLPDQHSRLLEQQRQLFERLLALPGEHGKLLEQMVPISEQLRQIPDLHDGLLERYRQLLDRQMENDEARLAGQNPFICRPSTNSNRPASNWSTSNRHGSNGRGSNRPSRRRWPSSGQTRRPMS